MTFSLPSLSLLLKLPYLNSHSLASSGQSAFTKLTYPEAIASDSGLDTRDLSSAMANHGAACKESGVR